MLPRMAIPPPEHSTRPAFDGSRRHVGTSSETLHDEGIGLSDCKLRWYDQMIIQLHYFGTFKH